MRNSKKGLHTTFLPPSGALGASGLPPVQLCASGWLPEANAFLLSRRHWAALEAEHSRYQIPDLAAQPSKPA